MASGSKAAGRERLQDANYRTGQPQFAMRCEICANCAAGGLGKQHDRYCEAHRAAVKTHGHCDHWAMRSAQR